MKKILSIFSMILLFRVSHAQTTWIRVNQVGYLQNDVKVAVWVSKEHKNVLRFEVVDVQSGKVVYSGNKIKNMGKQPAFESSARLDFSDFSRPGRYVIKVGETKSVPFSVGNSIYAGASEIPLKYMRQQRCGYNP